MLSRKGESMGFFKRFGSKEVSSELKERLIRDCAEGLMSSGMSPDEARNLSEDLFNEAIRLIKKDGISLDAPEDTGDQWLEIEQDDSKIHMMLDKKRAEGVTDEDIRWWWNRHHLEQRMIMLQDSVARMAALDYWKTKGLPMDAAIKKVCKAFPMYGDPADPAGGTGDDRLLPHELKDRINRFISKRLQTASDQDRLEGEVKLAESYSSFNAFIRAEMLNIKPKK